jgi:ubiquinone biosynthesis protein
MMEGLGVTLDPDFEVLEVARPYVSGLARRLASPVTTIQRALAGLSDWNEFMLTLPRQLPRTLDALESGNLRFGMRLEDMGEAAGKLSGMTNRLAVAILIAGFVISLSLLLSSFMPASLVVVARVLALLEFLSVTAMGAWFIFALWRSRRG